MEDTSGNPEHLPEYVSGMGALDKGRLEEAIHHFKDLIRKEASAHGGVKKARKAIEAKMASGEEGITLAIEQQKKNFYVRTQRAVLRLARAILLSLGAVDPAKDCKDAFEDASKSVELRQDDPQGRITRANVLLFSARYARDTGKDVRSIFGMAINDLNHALKVDPSLLPAWHNRGIILFYLANLDKREAKDPRENYIKAIDDLEKAIEADSTDAYVFKDLGVCRVALSRILLERGERPKELLLQAISDLSRAIELNRKLYGAFYERGMAYFSLKQFDLANADWKVCLELDPSREKNLAPLLKESGERMVVK